MKLTILSRTKPPITPATQKRWAKRAVDLLAKKIRLRKNQTLVVVWVGEAEGQKLNWQFRKRNYATDVLSFSAVEPDSLGELVFAVPIIRRQAKEHDLTVREEWLYLFIHGVLHLLGYDHEKSDTEARRMYRLQDQIFEELQNGSRHRTLRRKK